jgi:carboxymethylenebutenolidase
MSEMITFERPDGRECPAYYVSPAASDAAPGIVVLQEWWGVDEHIKDVAARLAASGYRALVPDLYRGRVTLDAAEAEHLMAELDFIDAASQDVRGAVMHLKRSSQRVAVIGFCLGGALSILAAIHVPELDAVCCWYGVPPHEAGDPRAIRVPVQGHFALKDEYFPPSVVEELEAKLKEAGVRYEFHRYPASHGFGRESAPYHDPEAAALAWQRSLDFLARYCPISHSE